MRFCFAEFNHIDVNSLILNWCSFRESGLFSSSLIWKWLF